jgi:hypothetical protein
MARGCRAIAGKTLAGPVTFRRGQGMNRMAPPNKKAPWEVRSVRAMIAIIVLTEILLGLCAVGLGQWEQAVLLLTSAPAMWIGGAGLIGAMHYYCAPPGDGMRAAGQPKRSW